jgi:hypothetical protein
MAKRKRQVKVKDEPVVKEEDGAPIAVKKEEPEEDQNRDDQQQYAGLTAYEIERLHM